MALLCYHKGCGQKFDPEKNTPDSCLFHPGFPIFHDALKGWSCCKKRTTDFSEFLSIKGCTRGFHSNEKPPEPEDSPDGSKAKMSTEVIVRGPKPAEVMERERPSSDEAKQLLPLKVTTTLEEALGKLVLSPKEQPLAQAPAEPPASLEVKVGTSCKNAGCKAVFQGAESNTELCLFHPGVPVFHEGMKYWSCCGIKTTDFTAFLEQEGCHRGKHTWVKKQGDKKLVSCRQDWHQTSNQVVVTFYAKMPLPALSSMKANHTVLDVHITFEGDKVFQAEFDLWGVISVEKSFALLSPSKVEVTLRKESPVTWAKLEHPRSRSQALQQPPETNALASPEGAGAAQEDSEDSLSWSDEEEFEEECEADLPELEHVPEGN